MRIITHDELTAPLEDQLGLLDMTAGWGALDFDRVRKARELYPSADYYGVYAVERDQLLSAVRVIRVPFTTAKGEVETIAGIVGVVTRRDRSKRGLARKLLEDVHRRERAVGERFSMLWTGHSNVAHRLYESLGYVDVYTARLAVRRCGRPNKPSGYELRKAKEKDAPTIERIHAEATAGRIGFIPRHPGLLKALFMLGWVRPESIRMILRDGEPVGYVEMQKEPIWTRSNEIVFSDRAEPDKILSLVESEAPNRWLALTDTFVNDNLALLRGRHYLFSDYLYYGLLAHRLDGAGSSGLAKGLGAGDRRFSCQSFDHF